MSNNKTEHNISKVKNKCSGELSCEDCQFLHYVKANPYGTSSNGFGCLYTGGHAIKRCKKYTIPSINNIKKEL